MTRSFVERDHARARPWRATSVTTIAIILGLVVCLACNTASAECLVPTPEIVFAHDIVFLGHVTDVRFLPDDASQVASVDVTLVWKGNVPKHVVIYRDARNVEAAFFESGQDYLLTPVPIPQVIAETRQLPTDTLFVRECASIRVDSDAARQWIKALGAARSPQ